MIECSLRRPLAALSLLACLFTPLGARALSLLDLQAGTSFASGDGSLMFSFEPGSVVLAGALAADLSLYDVQVLADGFRVTGPLSVADGGIGVLVLDYDVGAVAGTLASATLASLPSASGAGSLAFLGQAASGLGSQVNAATGGGLLVASDTTAAAGGTTSVVTTSLQLLTLGTGQLAAVGWFEQTFGVAVPEPSTSLLLLAGMLGLALLGNRRALK